MAIRGITINKGISGIITMGDILAGEREYNYFKNGRTHFRTLRVSQNSGQFYWMTQEALLNVLQVNSVQVSLGTSTPYLPAYCLSILLRMALIINDPKNSTMFNTGITPHVISIHNGDNILEIFREVIDIEAPKRAGC